MLSATGGGGGGGPAPGAACDFGVDPPQSCGTCGTMNCLPSGFWGPCIDPCSGGGGGGPVDCDDDPGPTCISPNDANCGVDEYCNSTTCTCEPLGGVGDPCDGDASTPLCDPDDSLCLPGLLCDSATCVCGGNPIIDWVSPVDASGIPNGAPGNLITLGGRFFGVTEGKVYFSDASGNPTIEAPFPPSVNPECSSGYWTDNQIIVVVPTGAQTGPIKVERLDGAFDETDDTQGPFIDDFQVNTIVRPGICSTTPTQGYFGDSFTVHGINFNGASQSIKFGTPSSNVEASGAGFVIGPPDSANAVVPNLAAGNTTLFVEVDGEASNNMLFEVLFDASHAPIIDYIDPDKGPPGQYITIYGSNFMDYQAGVSKVWFYHTVTGAVEADGLDFPIECQDGWWHDNYIVVKVPPALTFYDDYEVTVVNRDGFVSVPEIFPVLDPATNPPGPGLCKLDPYLGPVNTDVKLIGDNFGSSVGTVRFYNNVTVPPASISSWSNQEINTKVPAGAITGPVRVWNTASPQGSNSLNFTVGVCVDDSQCLAPDICCPAGSTWEGLCRLAADCIELSPPASEFGWTFNTNSGGGGGGVGSPCDSDPTTPTCNASSTLCAAGLVCNSTSCICEPSGGGFPGANCSNPTPPPICDPTFSCGADYQCMSGALGDCLCCCDPTIPQINAAGLQCVADKSPCSGASRGLYCGCVEDSECGDPNTVGCGIDTCCYGKLALEAVTPADEATEVCRNATIEGTFNKEINTGSLASNLVVLFDNESQPCPNDFPYFSQAPLQKKWWQRFAHSFVQLKNKIVRWIFPNLYAFSSPNPSHNFCRVSGRVLSYNEGGKGKFKFQPTQALPGEKTFYVVVVGDSNWNDDNKEGVRSLKGVTMGQGPYNRPTLTFNGKTYVNASAWQFTTRAEEGSNKGVCGVERVAVKPASYLFQTIEGNLNEDDSDALAPTFDTALDNDKLFVAEAQSANGEALSPIPGVYFWSWSWAASVPSIADIVDPPPANLTDNARLIRTGRVVDGKTEIQATANITDAVSGTTEIKTGKAMVYVFVCQNPWPAPDASGNWFPWRDAVEGKGCVTGGSCINTNFEFYYCRDAGEPGTADDLPVILSDDAVIRGSDPATDILKEYFFLREDVPDISTVNFSVVSVPVEGGKIELSWDDIPGAVEYVIYYGTKTGDYSQFISVPATSPHSVANPYILDGLDNDTTYYLVITAKYDNGAESEYSAEISATPKDTLPPPVPLNVAVATTTRGVVVSWDKSAGAQGYKIYSVGGNSCSAASTPPDCYGSFSDVGDIDSIEIGGLTPGVTYYFAVTAYDAYGNESNYSSEVGITP
ncbi:hypothetical protein D6821_02550 [Candidatus Parcubacteria bacterium]|nr:MAG: hypothetical protein D6821_02550 [Candidatus Parcubacteria bacterium]